LSDGVRNSLPPDMGRRGEDGVSTRGEKCGTNLEWGIENKEKFFCLLARRGWPRGGNARPIKIKKLS